MAICEVVGGGGAHPNFVALTSVFSLLVFAFPPWIRPPLPTCSSSSIRAARVRFMWPHVAAAVNAVTRGRRATTHVAKWALQGTVRTVPLRLCLEGCAAEDAAAAAAVGFCH